jgi:DNA-binding GntR family transcriptional regulator
VGSSDEKKPADSTGPRGDRVADILRAQIVSGRLQPSERLIEGQIASDLHTSRGPVREALRQLEYEGLVTSTPYRGATVVGISDEEVQVLMSLRLTLERFSFSKALQIIGEAELAELNKVVWQMERAASRNDLDAVVDADLRFHEAVLEMSGQPHTVRVWRSIETRIRAYFHRFDQDRDLNAIVNEHRVLFDALLVGKEDELLELLVEHIAVPIPNDVTA